jgi:hypothetical protein
MSKQLNDQTHRSQRDQELNLLIIGHGSIQPSLGTFTAHQVSVFTLAPPTASCVYPPDVLFRLRDELTNTVTESTSFLEFVSEFRESQQRHLGTDYCDKQWIGEFGKTGKYDPSKGCNVQYDEILEKQFFFRDSRADTPELGIWAYVSDLDDSDNNKSVQPVNVLHLLPELDPNYEPRYLFSQVIRYLQDSLSFDRINVIDCTCSVLMHKDQEQVSNVSRLQRKLQRRLVHLPVQMSNTPNTRKTRTTKTPNTRKRKIKTPKTRYKSKK